MGEHKVALIEPWEILELTREARKLIVRLWGKDEADKVYDGSTKVDHLADLLCATLKAARVKTYKDMIELAKKEECGDS